MPTPYEQARADFEAADRANLALFLTMDDAVSFGHMTQLPTSVLKALDYARECAAKLFVYLAEPAVKVVEAGPTEDQQPALVPETMELHADGSVTLTYLVEG